MREFKPSDLDSILESKRMPMRSRSIRASRQIKEKKETLIANEEKTNKKSITASKVVLAATCSDRWAGWFAKYLSQGKDYEKTKAAALKHLEDYSDETKKNENKKCIDEVTSKLDSLVKDNSLGKSYEEIIGQLSGDVSSCGKACTEDDMSVEECGMVEDDVTTQNDSSNNEEIKVESKLESIDGPELENNSNNINSMQEDTIISKEYKKDLSGRLAEIVSKLLDKGKTEFAFTNSFYYNKKQLNGPFSIELTMKKPDIQKKKITDQESEYNCRVFVECTIRSKELDGWFTSGIVGSLSASAKASGRVLMVNEMDFRKNKTIEKKAIASAIGKLMMSVQYIMSGNEHNINYEIKDDLSKLNRIRINISNKASGKMK